MPAPEFIPSSPGGGCPEGAGEGTTVGHPTLFPSPPALYPRLTGAPPEEEGGISTTLANQMQLAIARLQQALGLERREARLEAQILAAHALDVDRAWLIAHDRDALSTAHYAAIEIHIARREQGEPVAYILGEKEFYGRVFKVTPDVLIPRPETELLIEAALERLPRDRPASVLDLGTGSGCIALTLALERPKCQVWAMDRSEAALAVARANAQRLRVDGLRFLTAHWYAALGAESFDLIVANPPYIRADDPHLNRGDVRFEPVSSLSSGMSGLDDLSLIVGQAPRHLKPAGWLLVEHGWDQGDSCRTLFDLGGFKEIGTLRDASGNERVTLGRQPG